MREMVAEINSSSRAAVTYTGAAIGGILIGESVIRSVEDSINQASTYEHEQAVLHGFQRQDNSIRLTLTNGTLNGFKSKPSAENFLRTKQAANEHTIAAIAHREPNQLPGIVSVGMETSGMVAAATLAVSILYGAKRLVARRVDNNVPDQTHS